MIKAITQRYASPAWRLEPWSAAQTLPKEGPIEGDNESGIALMEGMKFWDDLRLSIAVGILQSNHFHSQRATRRFV